MTDAIKDRVRQLKAVVEREGMYRALSNVLGFDFSPQEHKTEIEDAATNLAYDLIREEYQKWVKHCKKLKSEGKL